MLRDRHGATALAFAASALVVMGCVALGTEVGMWYLMRRAAQGAADASAIAGALAANVAADPVAAAQTVATTNGFTAGATTSLGTVQPVVVNNPPSTGTHTGTATAVEVYVSEAITPLISALFTNSGTGPTVGARSVAVVEPVGTACALSLTGDMTISGTVTFNNCGPASNATDSTAINVTGLLAALTLTAVGDYAGIPPSPPLTRPAALYHPPTPDPYAGLASASLPTFSACAPLPAPDPTSHNIGIPTPLAPYETNPVAYCDPQIDGIAVNSVTLAPGTYFFYNGITMTGGALQCNGCAPGAGINIVVLGNSNTTLAIGPNAVLTTINAGANSFPALSGILFYGPSESTATISLVTTTIPLNDPVTAFSPMQGAIYFPQADLTFIADYASTCLSVVAGTMTLSGTFSLAPTGCNNFGTALAQMQGARLVE